MDKQLSPERYKRLERETAELEKKIAKKKLERKQHLASAKQFEFDNKLLFLDHPGKGYLGPNGRWELNPAQSKMKQAINSGAYRIFNMSGGNQQGKTFFGVYFILAMLRGCWPEEDIKKVGTHLWEKYNWGNEPKFIRFCSDSWEGRIKKNLVEQGLNPLWPKSWPVRKEHNNMRIPYVWKCLQTGSQIHLMTHKQGSEAFEGIKSHLIVCDEPFPSELWAPIARGAVALGGLIGVFASVVKQDQLWMEEMLSNMGMTDEKMGKVFSLKSAINTNEGYGLTKDGIDFFRSTIPDDEKEIRIDGGSLLKRTRVIDLEDQHIIEKRFKIPHTWYCTAAIDIGISKPHDLLIEAMAPDGVKYLAFELNCAKTDEFMDRFLEIVKKNNLRMNPIVICDPLAKADKNNDMTTWGRMERSLQPFGMLLKKGDKNKGEGVRQINDRLNPLDTIPRLYVFKDMRRTIMQIKSIKFDDTGLIYKPRSNEKPGDDQFENCYRLMLENTHFIKYENPRDKKIIKPLVKNVITGY